MADIIQNMNWCLHSQHSSPHHHRGSRHCWSHCYRNHWQPMIHHHILVLKKKIVCREYSMGLVLWICGSLVHVNKNCQLYNIYNNKKISKILLSKSRFSCTKSPSLWKLWGYGLDLAWLSRSNWFWIQIYPNSKVWIFSIFLTKVLKCLNHCFARLRSQKSVSSKTAVDPASRFCDFEILFPTSKSCKTLI